MRSIIAWAVVGVHLIVSSGCGTIFSGTSQDLKLRIDPPDTEVSVYRWSGERIGGPQKASVGKMKIHRPVKGEPYLVQAAREQYCPQYWLTGSKESAGSWVALPLVLPVMIFPLIGVLVVTLISLVDQQSGGCCSATPDTFSAHLLEDSACPE